MINENKDNETYNSKNDSKLKNQKRIKKRIK